MAPMPCADGAGDANNFILCISILDTYYIR